MENCANEWNLILFDRYTPVNDKIGYGENRESDKGGETMRVKVRSV